MEVSCLTQICSLDLLLDCLLLTIAIVAAECVTLVLLQHDQASDLLLHSGCSNVVGV